MRLESERHRGPVQRAGALQSGADNRPMATMDAVIVTDGDHGPFERSAGGRIVAHDEKTLRRYRAITHEYG